MKIKKENRKKIFITAILIVCVLVIPMVVAMGVMNENRSQNDSSSLSMRHTIELLDPNEVDISISKDAAVQIAIGIRSTPPEDAIITLIKNNAWQKIYWDISWDEKDSPVLIRVDAETGELISLMDCPNYVGGIDVITDDASAIIIAKEYLESFGLSIKNLSQPQVTINEEFFGKVYRVMWWQENNNILVDRGFTTVTLDPGSGNLISVWRVWHDVSTVNTVPSIAMNDAMQIAKEQLQTTYDLPNDAKLVSVDLEIKRPNYWWDEYGCNNKQKPLFGDYALLWIVTFQDKRSGDWYNVEAWVDAHTGKLVGGDMMK